MACIRYVYKQKNLHEDNVLTVAEKLYDCRLKKKISLRQASELSGVALLDIDALETMRGDIDFRKVAKLLDIYGERLAMGTDIFPYLPKEYYRKYFGFRTFEE